MDYEKEIGSDEMAIIVQAHEELLKSGKGHMDVKQFISEWINREENTSSKKKEDFVEWSDSSDEEPAEKKREVKHIETKEHKEPSHKEDTHEKYV